jgi:hypothetical protein
MNLLYSGGNMAAGSKAPADEITLGHQIKTLYPSLDLLGGAVDGFILPKSRLRLSAWIVAKEYAELINHIHPELYDEAMQTSAFDMVQEETKTRGTGGSSDGNQMLYTYETLSSGVKLLVEITLDPHTPDVTQSAVAQAINCWDGYIGGQSRQGRGRMAIVSQDLISPQAYLDHLDGHEQALRDGLTTGNLGTGKILCA